MKCYSHPSISSPVRILTYLGHRLVFGHVQIFITLQNPASILAPVKRETVLQGSMNPMLT